MCWVCARAFSSCGGERGPLFIAVRRPLTVAASLVAEHRLQTRRLSSCGTRAQLLRGMRDFPRQGLEPVSPALAGRFSTTAPPGKPFCPFLSWIVFLLLSFKFFAYFGHQSFVKYVFCQYFLTLCGLSFHSFNSVLCRENFLYFNKVQLINFFLSWFILLVVSEKVLGNLSSPKFYSMFFLKV